MFRHTTTTIKPAGKTWFHEADPAVDQQYVNWIQSQPGVVGFSRQPLNANTLQRIIDFTDQAAYTNWLAARKNQSSWSARKTYESQHNITSTSTKAVI